MNKDVSHTLKTPFPVSSRKGGLSNIQGSYLQENVPHIVCWLLLALEPEMPIWAALHLRWSL